MYTKSFHEGIRFKLLGNYDKAQELFKLCLKEAPNDDASHFALAQISLMQGDLELAKNHTIQAAQLDKTNLYYQIELGYMYREMGEFEKSARVFEEIIAKRPTNSNYYFECALSWEMKGDLNKAITTLNKLENNIGVKTEASLKKHHWYKDQDKLKEAEQELINIFEIDNNNEYIIATLVDFYLNTGEISKGIGHLKRLVKLDPKNGTGLILLAEFEYERKELNNAKEYYLKAILSETLKAKEAIEALNFFLYHKDFKLTDSILENTSNLYSQNDSIMMFIGDFYLENENFKKARFCFQRAIESNPGSYSIWEKLLYVLYDSQNWVDLAEQGKKTIRIFPLKTIPYYMTSVALNQSNQFALAKQIANEGLLTVSNEAIIQSDLQGQIAESYFGLELFNEAIKEYLKAIESAKNEQNEYLTFNFCLRLYENNMDLDLSLKLLDGMLNKNGTDFDLLLLKGDVYFKKEAFTKALLVYMKLKEIPTFDGKVDERIGDTYAKLNNIKEALIYWKAAEKSDSNNELLKKKIINEAYFE